MGDLGIRKSREASRLGETGKPGDKEVKRERGIRGDRRKEDKGVRGDKESGKTRDKGRQGRPGDKGNQR